MSEQLEQVFSELISKSWKYYNEEIQNTRIDDLLVGAVITSLVEQGYSLIDLSSNGRHHYLRFEWLQTRQRVIFQLTSLAEDLVTAKVVGRKANVVVGMGEHVQNANALWSAFRQEVKSGFLDQGEPGVITMDADVTAGYIYVQVPIILDLDQYFGEGLTINYDLLRQHLYACMHSLSKYLRGRLTA